MAVASRAAPRVSVIVPFFNAQRFFKETIESVRAQDFHDWELLLIDDGSTDASTATARDYQRKYPDRIRYLEHPAHANRGVCASRNLGVRAARGDLLAFLDADDRWLPNKLREQAEILDLFAEVGGVCGTARYWQSWEGGEDWMVPSGHVRHRPIKPPEAVLELYPLGKAAAPCPSDLMMRRSAVESIGGFEESFVGAVSVYEDQAFLAKFYLRHTIYFSDKHWLDYRIHDQSCMAEAKRAGTKHQARHQFLTWLECYLDAGRHNSDPRIRRALNRALFQYRHKHAARTLSFARKIARRLVSAKLEPVSWRAGAHHSP